MGDRYCKVDDLLIGDLGDGDNENPDKFINSAADEMDAMLGQVFVIPLAPIAPATVLPPHVLLALKNCNAKIASGLFLMDANANGSSEGLSAHAQWLHNDGRQMLMAMVNRRLDIGAVLIASQATGDTPLITQTDTTSGVEAFYQFVSGDPTVFTGMGPVSWRPGITA